MSRPSQAESSDPFAQCLQTLVQLCGSSDVNFDTPDISAILKQAALLLKRVKKRRSNDMRGRDLDLMESVGLRTSPNVTELPDVESPKLLARPHRCYICSTSYQSLHSFYDRLCPSCADLNFQKRNYSANLSGKIALVTGVRIKVGYQVALKLLRAGATVIGTTRFPTDAARRFATEPDATEWASRLHLHALDLRFLPTVEAFAKSMRQSFSHLDILIQNAAQTIRRPAAFYRHLVQGEREASLPRLAQGMIASKIEHELVLDADPHFPIGRFDEHGEQIDLRPLNSWGMDLSQIETSELVEVTAINCLAPFVLMRELEPMLEAGNERDRWIILVSAAEGQFDTSWKTGKHPHTNMAKASLNMITRTCAADYAERRILLNSVDPGWISLENSAPIAEKMREQGVRPPLDAVDAAARVLDPIWNGERLWGQYLRHFRSAAW